MYVYVGVLAQKPIHHSSFDDDCSCSYNTNDLIFV